jgi:HprK-related kinase A
LTSCPFVPLDTLPADTVRHWLQQGRLALRTGPLCFRISTGEAVVADNLQRMYARHPVADSPPFADFHITLARPPGLRRWLAPQTEFRLDGHTPFLPLPAQQSFALFEWGMNWCIASHCHQYLILHAAVVARGDNAVLLPAPPGAGKSTLCAWLTSKGWRLLSDELALIDPADRQVYGLARPINLKNSSIALIRRLQPTAILTPPVPDTAKGTVAHLAPTPESVAQVARPARLRHIVTPRYRPGSALDSAPIPRPEALAMLIDNAFNYDILGADGFSALAGLLSDTPALDLHYADLDAALDWFNALPA